MNYRKRIILVLLFFLTIILTCCSIGKKRLSIQEIKEISKGIVKENLTNTFKDSDIEEISVLASAYLHDDKYISNVLAFLDKTNNYRAVCQTLRFMNTSNSIKELENLFVKEKSLKNKLLIAQYLMLNNDTKYFKYLEYIIYNNNDREIDEMLVEILKLLALEKLNKNKRLLYNTEEIVKHSMYIADKPSYKDDKIVMDCVRIWALATHPKTVPAIKYFLKNIKTYDIYQTLYIAEEYLERTNDIEFLSYLEDLHKGMMDYWNEIDDNYRNLIKIVISNYKVILYRHTKNKELKKEIEDFFEREVRDNKLMLKFAMFLKKYKYIKKSLNEEILFQFALNRIFIDSIYEAKKDLLHILKNGFPSSWNKAIKDSEENKKAVILNIVDVIFYIIETKSPDKTNDIQELSFLLFYDKGSSELNRFVRLVTAWKMLSTIERIEKRE